MVVAGETINVPVGTLPASKIITIKYAATVNTPPLARQVQTQGTVSGSNFASVLTDDPDAAGASNPTVTLVDTLVTWNGATNTDWNTASNWTVPAPGAAYAPGVSNPAVNDVVIPNVGAQPNITACDQQRRRYRQPLVNEFDDCDKWVDRHLEQQPAGGRARS